MRAELADASLTGADLSKADLSEANLGGADLSFANLNHSNLFRAGLRHSSLYGADMTGINLTSAQLALADLSRANLSGAQAAEAILWHADLAEANLSQANLSGADLSRAILVGANLSGAKLDGARVYGVSAWDVNLRGTQQLGLVITSSEEAEVIVDNLEVAQFMYLLLNNEKIKEVIDTITSKVVLILGGFADERKAVLNALREVLRLNGGLIPVVFDFAKPANKDVTGTVETLARMARFIVADLTDPRSVPYELATIVPFLRTTPVVLLRLAGTAGGTMVKDLEAFDRWVVPVREYPDLETLLRGLDDYVVRPAEQRLKLLRPGEQNPL